MALSLANCGRKDLPYELLAVKALSESGRFPLIRGTNFDESHLAGGVDVHGRIIGLRVVLFFWSGRRGFAVVAVKHIIIKTIKNINKLITTFVNVLLGWNYTA